MKCYKVTVKSIIIIREGDKPPNLWKGEKLLLQMADQPVLNFTIEEMTTITTTRHRKCGACGELGHNRRKCLNA
tara:strand:- start:311 stop:532 length:222 start_codon:yes stop_codon:yes gene_type:complete